MDPSNPSLDLWIFWLRPNPEFWIRILNENQKKNQHCSQNVLSVLGWEELFPKKRRKLDNGKCLRLGLGANGGDCNCPALAHSKIQQKKGENPNFSWFAAAVKEENPRFILVCGHWNFNEAAAQLGMGNPAAGFYPNVCFPTNQDCCSFSPASCVPLPAKDGPK